MKTKLPAEDATPSLRADILMHPIRIRIALAVQSRRLTTAQIHRLLPDVPMPTLYRHLQRLTEAGIIEVVTTQQAHSNQERVYALVQAQSTLTSAEVAAASLEDHRRYFTMFVTGLLSVYDRYLQSSPDNIANNIAYVMETVYMTESQFAQARTQMRGFLADALGREPEPGATRKMLAVLAFPEAETDPDADASE